MRHPPLLRYPGSKHSLAPWILSHLPAHDSYCEAFAGSAAVLLAKERSPLEALNDKSGDIVNLLRMLRERPDLLIEQIRWTPWAAEEYQLAFEPTDDPLEKARRFYARCWMSIRPFNTSPSFRRQKVLSRGRNGDKSPMTAAAHQFMRVDHLWTIAERLRGVTIENLDALDFIQLYDGENTLFYLDPPYALLTRTQDAHYEHEMLTVEEHKRLAAVLQDVRGMVVLSHYACDHYREWYEANGWKRVDKSARIDGGGSATESLYLNPQAVERKRHADLPLFADVTVVQP